AYTQDYRWLNREALERTRAFCDRYGGAALLIAPYVAVVRTFAPFVAGVSSMCTGCFLAASAMSSALWVAGLVLGGYWFGNIPLIRDNLNTLVLGGAATGVSALAIGALVRFRRRG
ncbi:MAG TPA: hypothetical protein VF798_06005, partial [Burkholderiaceae bacterium]